MRGVPGSGKSYLASLLRESYMKKGYSCSIYSTDNFFMKDGVYSFDPSKLGEYHDY
jgi:pantothenate kinase-related protein Tda10